MVRERSARRASDSKNVSAACSKATLQPSPCTQARLTVSSSLGSPVGVPFIASLETAPGPKSGGPVVHTSTRDLPSADPDPPSARRTAAHGLSTEHD